MERREVGSVWAMVTEGCACVFPMTFRRAQSIIIEQFSSPKEFLVLSSLPPYVYEPSGQLSRVIFLGLWPCDTESRLVVKNLDFLNFCHRDLTCASFLMSQRWER